MDRFRDRFSMAGAKDGSRDAEVMSSSLRTDPRCFRRLAPADRSSSNCANGRASLRNSASNGPASPTGCVSGPPRTLERPWRPNGCSLLKQRRIRRLDASMILKTLRVPPPLLAPGTIESASAHVASLIPRLRLLNRQSHDAERKLEALTVRLVAAEETEPGQKKQHDV
jgi:hypothetical protein